MALFFSFFSNQANLLETFIAIFAYTSDKRYKMEKILLSLALSDSPRKPNMGRSSKRIMIYAIIGIAAIAAVYISISLRSGSDINNSPAINTQNDEARAQLFEQQFCGTNTTPNSNTYVNEVTLPTGCEMPVGIAVDGGKVWYVSTKRGILGSYDNTTGSFMQYEIP